MYQHFSMEITKDSYLRSRLKGFPGGPGPGMKLAVSCVLGIECLPKTRMKKYSKSIDFFKDHLPRIVHCLGK